MYFCDSKKIKNMKRIAFFLILSFLAFYFVACQSGGGKNENVNEQDSVATNVAVPLEIPEKGDFVFAKFGGIERVFAVKPQMGSVNHTEEFGPKANMFRIERLVDANRPDDKVVIQLHNFELRGIKAPFRFAPGGKSQQIIVMYAFKAENGQIDLYKSIEPFEVNIEKIEGDVYEGTFQGPMSYGNEVVKAEGKFRITMVDPINAKKPV